MEGCQTMSWMVFGSLLAIGGGLLDLSPIESTIRKASDAKKLRLIDFDVVMSSRFLAVQD